MLEALKQINVILSQCSMSFSNNKLNSRANTEVHRKHHSAHADKCDSEIRKINKFHLNIRAVVEEKAMDTFSKQSAVLKCHLTST